MNLETVKWFLARSDAEAAMRILNRSRANSASDLARLSIDGDLARKVKTFDFYIERFWPSLFGKYADVYRVAGEVEARVPGEDVVRSVPGQWRYQAALRLMQQVMSGYAHILDFGCSRGAHAINLHNDTGNKRFTCLDIDPLSIEQAQDLCGKLAKFPSMFEFAVETEETPLPARKHDGAMLFEVMEHVLDLGKLVDKVEASVKEGGWVMASVPSGPVEYTMWMEHPERMREHVREVALDDILDMFGKKRNLNVQYAMTGKSKHIDMFEGCYFFAWQVDGSPTGEIDWERKLSAERRFAGGLPGWEP